ncbi:MAG: AMP-binding protein [Actinomycetota bacterium]|nr:AMP-binding protein [Actinomycetota bacterium]
MNDYWLLMGDVPGRAAHLWKDNLALVFKGDRWTHGEFAADVEKVARGLIALGVERGDHVAVWMTNRPEWLHLMYAIPRVGACVVPLNTRYRTDDVAYTVVQSESKFLIALDRSGPINYGEMLTDAREELDKGGYLHTIVMLGERIENSVGWQAMLAGGDAIDDETLEHRASEVDVEDRMMLAYTSGTTGHPKGVIHSHKPVRNTYERAMLLGHSRNDVHLSYLPLFHAYGFSEVAMMAGLTGGSQVLFDVFDPDEVLDAVESERGTVLHGFDSHWADLIRAQNQRAREVSSLRVGTLPAGMESTIPTARLVQDVFCPTTSGFGMSESWAFIASSHVTDSLEQRTEASGYPMHGIEFQVRDLDSGEVVGANEPGALHVKGYTVMNGYWGKPEATAEVFDSDGWLDTGDVALLRQDGHVVFIGRHKDMLKVGGENVSPAEVEGYLLEMDGVEEIAVVSYPDERLVEVPVAFVVGSSDLSADDLLDRCRGKIASFKIPRHIIFVKEMPVTPSGKIRKVELREWALAQIN